MPAGNGMGPMGMGPMTGRGAGTCAGSAMSGFMTSGRGRGMGFGRGPGCGRGRRNGFRATGIPGWMRAGVAAASDEGQDELAGLKSQAEVLGAALDNAKERIRELEAKAVKA